jgi:hypothetical protein
MGGGAGDLDLAGWCVGRMAGAEGGAGLAVDLAPDCGAAVVALRTLRRWLLWLLVGAGACGGGLAMTGGVGVAAGDA